MSAPVNGMEDLSSASREELVRLLVATEKTAKTGWRRVEVAERLADDLNEQNDRLRARAEEAEARGRELMAERNILRLAICVDARRFQADSLLGELSEEEDAV